MISKQDALRILRDLKEKDNVAGHYYYLLLHSTGDKDIEVLAEIEQFVDAFNSLHLNGVGPSEYKTESITPHWRY